MATTTILRNGLKSSRPAALAEPESDPFNVHADSDVSSEGDKDETEQDLERLVFGDRAGFRAGLKEFGLEDERRLTSVPTETGLEDLDDAALFFTDLGDAAGEVALQANSADSDEDGRPSTHSPAWEDSDDERLMVSLAAVPRLRKLRRTEDEDVVNGKEYAKRLRRQFEMLHPRPEWARTARERPLRKRRRLSEDINSGEDNTSEDEMDMDDDAPTVAPLAELLQDAQSLVRSSQSGSGKKRKLRPEVLDIQRTTDIAGIQPSAITCLSFHPQLPLMLSSGPSSTLYLHQISPSPPAPSPNPLLTNMHVRGVPLSTTAFHPTDSRIFLSGPRRYFHLWNLESGLVEKVARIYGQQHEQKSMERFKLSPDGKHMALLGSTKKGGGIVNIVSASTLQWICQVRIESRGGIADFAWWRDSRGMCIVGKGGEVSEWSVASQSVIARWQDEGAVGTTVLALGGQHELAKSPIGTDRWVSIGSSSGIVNIYDRRVWAATSPTDASLPVPIQPKPIKVLDHLTTPTSNLVFSPDGQILAMSSKWKRDSIKLVHLPSCTVYRNWPTSSTPLGRITSVAFCRGDRLGEDLHSVIAIANEQGKIRLWEIR